MIECFQICQLGIQLMIPDVNSGEIIFLLLLFFGLVVTVARLLGQYNNLWSHLFTNGCNQVNTLFCVYEVATELRETFADCSTDNAQQ
jgi:hypothetical protein